jgi:hypothetical protein
MKLNSQKQTWRLSHQGDKNFSNNLKPDEQINSPALALFPSYFRLHPTSHRSNGAADRPLSCQIQTARIIWFCVKILAGSRNTGMAQSLTLASESVPPG